MDGLIFDSQVETTSLTKSGKKKAPKRVWREIEALQDRKRLIKELEDIDLLADHSSDDFDF
ncbi:MAG: DUF3545 family protein [Aliivibrio sp.]|uniref:DUF3545 family protein n=1 Tax=Aliivibrio sp. TaxID=1872443 RepID=UPI001A639B31|nr:DUF3545 family protein [Aliivibrio sp.]